MQAAILKKPFTFEIREKPIPALKSGWALIQVKAAGICGSDLHYYAGGIPLSTEVLRGHEAAGVVAHGGDTKFTPGEAVAVNPLVGCAVCDACKRGDVNICKDLKSIGGEYEGGFSEFVAVPEQNLYPFNNNLIPFEYAALTDCVAVALHAVKKVSLKENEKVAVIGDGAIGLLLVQIAKIFGAKDILLIGKHHSNLNVGAKLGADSFLDISSKDLSSDEVNQYDAVFEAVGGKNLPLKLGIRLLKPGGRLGILGVSNMETIEVPWLDVVLGEKTLYGLLGYSKGLDQDEMREAITLMEKGLINLDALITDRLPFEEIDKGFQLMLNKDKSQTIKVVLTM